MGRKPQGLAPLKTWTSAERAFISIPGTIKAISGTEKARGLPHVRDLFLRIAEGDKVDFPRNNVSKCGNIISAAPDRATAITAAETAAKSILIRLDPEDSRTSDFLSLNERRKNLTTENTEDTEREKENILKLRATPCTPWFNILPGQPPSSSTFPPDAFLLTDEQKAALSALPETTITPHSSFLISHFSFPLVAFPTFTSSALKDYMGRTVTESLEAIQELTGFSFIFIEVPPEIPSESGKSTDNKEESFKNPEVLEVSGFLGRSFWAALARGGYQGAAYYIDQWGRK
jgi:hypothetical protein